MGLITIETPFNIDLEFMIAGFHKRFMAWLIDMIIICIYFYITYVFVSPLIEKSNTIGMLIALFAIIIPVMFYQMAFELLMNGQTLGKKLVGIKIIDKEGKEPTIGQYITRWILCIGNLFVYLVPIFFLYALGNPFVLISLLIINLPDILFISISKKSQKIGDIAAGTVVIDSRYKPNINETIYLEIEKKDYIPVFPQVMRLSDRDINGIRNLVKEKRPSKDAEMYTIEVAQKIKNVLGIESDLYPTDFLHQLLKDYNYFTTK